MKNICFYFHLHLPVLLKRYRFFDIGKDNYYTEDFQTEESVRNIVEKSYLDANRTILEMIRSSNGKFRCAYSMSGVTIELLERYAPEVIDSFKELAKTGNVEFLATPYAQSLCSVFDAEEFSLQLKMQADKIESMFGKRPTTVFNSELIYSDEIGEIASGMGFKSMIIDEAKHILGWKSPNFVYTHSSIPKFKLLIRNNKLSDDIAFRFSNISLNSETFIHWIDSLPADNKIINLGFGYEVFGINQPANTGIFDFLKSLPYHAMEQQVGFVLPTEFAKKCETSGPLSVPYPISWVGKDKDLTLWTGNDLQQEALSKLYAVGTRIRMCKDKSLLYSWFILQTTDHFRYMSHKNTFGTQYESAYDAFTNYMNVLADFLDRVSAQFPSTIENEELNELLTTINNQDIKIEKLEKELKTLKSKTNRKPKVS